MSRAAALWARAAVGPLPAGAVWVSYPERVPGYASDCLYSDLRTPLLSAVGEEESVSGYFMNLKDNVTMSNSRNCHVAPYNLETWRRVRVQGPRARLIY